jgi:F0F1-type ATP synthase epsilon subunit
MAPSFQLSIAEATVEQEEEEEEVTISQSTALRGELIEEERLEHEKRVAREEARKVQENKDKSGGWLSRLLLAKAVEEEADQT